MKYMMSFGIEDNRLWAFAWTEIRFFKKAFRFHRRKIEITDTVWALYQEYITT